jgi:membrane protease YdiL (CAAX protease family)
MYEKGEYKMQPEMTLSTALSKREVTGTLKPMGWKLSLLYFGIPALGVVAAYYGFRPWLEKMGYPELVSYLAALAVPLALMFAAALVFCQRIDGWPLTRESFAARMRYPRLRLSDVLWGAGIAVLGMALSFGIFSQIALFLVHSGLIPLPAGLPVLDNPQVEMSLEMFTKAAGGQIRGQWGILLLYLVQYFFNIAGEELWWRGYILPRQELVFGRFAWLVHGLMWACFHVFKWWDIITLIPICLLIAYTSQKRQNNWAGLIAHAIINGMGVILTVAAVAGWM